MVKLVLLWYVWTVAGSTLKHRYIPSNHPRPIIYFHPLQKYSIKHLKITIFFFHNSLKNTPNLPSTKMIEELESKYDQLIPTIQQQKLQIPLQQLAYLSSEQILFGNVCARTVNYRVVTLKNNSDTDTFQFEWQSQYIGKYSVLFLDAILW